MANNAIVKKSLIKKIKGVYNMNITMEEFVKIADNACEKHKYEIVQIYKEVVEEVVVKMYKNGLSIRKYCNEEEKCWSDSWEWIMMTQRIEGNLVNYFTLELLFSLRFNDLVDKLEKKGR
jgi:phosphoribosylaminoimidazole-succinocarboxamide synthase